MTLLIANRGEIAVRIARTAREMGIRTVAVHSDVDSTAMHVLACDEAVCIGGPAPAQSYLDGAAILAAARATGTTMIHPGYGFLSENADFAEAVETAGLTWVGPTPESMRALGGKLPARAHAVALGIPVLPGATPDPAGDLDSQVATLHALGLPLLIKASAGGGGRGMRRVNAPGELESSLLSARAEALGAFGDSTVYAERLVAEPRHIEVQVLGDGLGGVRVYGERDCSIQRRHQKLIEESPAIGDALAGLRPTLHEYARSLAASVRYRSAGTVEFLWDGQQVWFLEVNARLQVEHPVTELVFSVDLVRAQLEIAMGGGLPGHAEPRGHAIECRIVAEDPARGYLPSPGTLGQVTWPTGPGVRVDAGVRSGDVVSPHYDALLAKIIVHASTREAARQRMIRALDETFVSGIATTAERLGDVLRSEVWTAGAHSTLSLDGIPPRPEPDPAWVLAAMAFAEPAGRQGTGAGAGEVAGPWQTIGRWP